VASTVYYCEVHQDVTTEFPKGIFAITSKKSNRTKITRCISYSDKVWAQGPQGGVRIIKDRTSTGLLGYTSKNDYVTRNDKSMKRFMWVKLKAQVLTYYR
jgi:hypothetical protein